MARFELDLTDGGPLLQIFAGSPVAYKADAEPDIFARALVDTGAWMSAISPSAVARANPPHLGVETVTRAGGVRSVHATYLVRVRGCGAGGRWLEVEAVEIEPASEGIDFIIGRDLLRKMIFHWDGPAGVAWIEY